MLSTCRKPPGASRGGSPSRKKRGMAAPDRKESTASHLLSMAIRREQASVGSMTQPIRTQVAIIGAGPAGLLLAQLLHQHGIESVVLEAKSRDYVENRVRAGVLEHQSVDILNEAGAGQRMMREGLLHRGITLHFGGHDYHVDFEDLVGRAVMIYGQQEVVRDLIALRLAAKQPLHFEVEDVSVHDFQST